MSVGIHVPFLGFEMTKQQIEGIGFDNYCQIMTGNPQSVDRKDISRLVPFAKNPNFDKSKCIIHAALCTNICRKQLNGFTMQYLRREIEIANLLGIHYICLHPGFLNKSSEEEALENIAFVMGRLQPLLKKTGVKILLEVMPDKTSMYMHHLDQYKHIRDNLPDDVKEVVGYLIDTCHYHDGHNGMTLKKLLDDINENELPYPDYLHLNNSSYTPKHKSPVYKNNPKDRHRCITEDGGTIPEAELKTIYTHFSAHNIPIVLETYHSAKDFQRDILYLKK